MGNVLLNKVSLRATLEVKAAASKRAYPCRIHPMWEARCFLCPWNPMLSRLWLQWGFQHRHCSCTIGKTHFSKIITTHKVGDKWEKKDMEKMCRSDVPCCKGEQQSDFIASVNQGTNSCEVPLPENRLLKSPACSFPMFSTAGVIPSKSVDNFRGQP